MSVALLYAAGILLVALVLHIVRGRRSAMWRPSIPREVASKESQTRHPHGETALTSLIPHEEEQTDDQELVHQY